MTLPFNASVRTELTPSETRTHLNSLYLDLISRSETVDCQSFALVEGFAKYYRKVKDSIAFSIEQMAYTNSVELNSYTKAVLITDVPYTAISKTKVLQPEGLNVNFLQYVELLIRVQTRSNDVIPTVLDPVSKFFGSAIGDKAFRNQIHADSRALVARESQFDELNKEFAVSFSKNGYGDKVPMSNAIKRCADWPIIYSRTKALKDLYHEFPTKEIGRRLNRLYEAADIFLEGVNDGTYDTSDKSLTKNIADGLYHAAREVEFAATSTFRSAVFIKTMSDNIRVLELLVEDYRIKN